MTAASSNMRYMIFAAVFILLVFMTREALQSRPYLVREVHEQLGNAFHPNQPEIDELDTNETAVNVTAPIQIPVPTIQTGDPRRGKYYSDSPDSFDVVLNYYKENTTELAEQLDELRAMSQFSEYSEVRVFVYVKDEQANLEELKQIFKTPYVVLRPNKGRESGSFLTHIMENWDNLGAHTFFRQADMHEYGQAMSLFKKYLLPPSEQGGPHTGMLSVGWMDVCQCTRCTDAWDGSRVWTRIPEIYSSIHGGLCPENIVITYFGQFVVSRKRIRDNNKYIYGHLREVLLAEMDHWIHKDPKPDSFPDNPNAPYFGHTLERIWLVLFRCESTKLTDSCGAGLGAYFNAPTMDDPITKCQCLDE